MAGLLMASPLFRGKARWLMHNIAGQSQLQDAFPHDKVKGLGLP